MGNRTSQGHDVPQTCAACGITFAWEGVARGGAIYCCGSCAAGGVCQCAYEGSEGAAQFSGGEQRNIRLVAHPFASEEDVLRFGAALERVPTIVAPALEEISGEQAVFRMSADPLPSLLANLRRIPGFDLHVVRLNRDRIEAEVTPNEDELDDGFARAYYEYGATGEAPEAELAEHPATAASYLLPEVPATEASEDAPGSTAEPGDEPPREADEEPIMQATMERESAVEAVLSKEAAPFADEPRQEPVAEADVAKDTAPFADESRREQAEHLQSPVSGEAIAQLLTSRIQSDDAETRHLLAEILDRLDEIVEMGHRTPQAARAPRAGRQARRMRPTMRRRATEVIEQQREEPEAPAPVYQRPSLVRLPYELTEEATVQTEPARREGVYEPATAWERPAPQEPARREEPERQASGRLMSDRFTIVAYPFANFQALNAFQRAVRNIEGVKDATVSRFFKGTLHLAVEYTGVVSFLERLRSLPIPHTVVEVGDESIEVRIEDSGSLAAG